MTRLGLGEAVVSVRYDMSRFEADMKSVRSSIEKSLSGLSSIAGKRSSAAGSSAVGAMSKSFAKITNSVTPHIAKLASSMAKGASSVVQSTSQLANSLSKSLSRVATSTSPIITRVRMAGGGRESVGGGGFRGGGNVGGSGGGGSGDGFGQAFMGGFTGGAFATVALNAFGKVYAKIDEMVRGAWAFNSQMESLNQSFTVMLGSAAAASRVTQSLAKFANETPFELAGVSKVATMLLSTQKIAERQLIPTLKKIGDVSAASAEGFSAFPRVARALSQMLTKGRVTAEEMMQLAEAGVPAWQHLADAMGKSQAQVQQMSSNGELRGDAVLKLIDQMGKAYEGLAAKQSKTWMGLVSTLKDNVTQATAAITKPMFELAKIKLGNLVDFFNSKEMAAGIETLRSAVSQVSRVFANIADSGIVPIAIKVAGLAVAVGATMKAFSALAFVSSVVFSPFMVTVAAVSAGVVLLKKQLEAVMNGSHGNAIRKSLGDMWSSIKNIGISIKENVIALWEKASPIIEKTMKSIAENQAWREAVAFVKKIVDMVELFSADWSVAWELAQQSAKTVFDGMSEYMDAMMLSIGANFTLALVGAIDSAKAAMSELLKMSEKVLKNTSKGAAGAAKAASGSIAGSLIPDLFKHIGGDAFRAGAGSSKAGELGAGLKILKDFVGGMVDKTKTFLDSKTIGNPLKELLEKTSKDQSERMKHAFDNASDKAQELIDKLRKARDERNKKREDAEMIESAKEQAGILGNMASNAFGVVQDAFASLMGKAPQQAPQQTGQQTGQDKSNKGIQFNTSEGLYRDVAEALNAKKTDADKNTGTMVSQLDKLLKVFGVKGVSNIPGAKDIAERVNKVVAPTKEALKDVAGPLWNAIAKPFGLPTIDDVHRPKVLDKKQRADAFPVGKGREKAEEAATWYEKLLDDMKGVKDNAQEIRDMLDKNLNKEQYDAEVKLREILDANLNGGGLSVDSSGVSITDEMAKVSEQMAKNYAKENSPEADNEWKQVDKDQLDVLRSIRDSVGRFPDYLGFE